MTEHYEVKMMRSYQVNGETKTAYTKVGVMFATQDGRGFRIKLDAIPVPTIYDNKVELSMVAYKPEPREDYNPNMPKSGQAPSLDDPGIPF